MVDRHAGWPSRLGLGGLAESVATPFVRRAAWVILSVGGLVPLVWLLTTPGHGFDFYAYWAVDVADPYTVTDSFGAFHYPPPFVWLFAPLRLLSFEMGYWLWTAVGAGALIWLTGRWALAWLLFPPVTSELFHGNVHLLMAAALVLGFRVTPAWAFVGLAKITTGVIGLWPLLRREWRTVLVLVATVAIVCLPSLILAPELWARWIDHLLVRGAEPNLWGAEIGIPLVLRFAVAVLLIGWGSRGDRRWVLAPAVTLALPILWFHGLAILTALPRLLREAPGRDMALESTAAAAERQDPVGAE